MDLIKKRNLLLEELNALRELRYNKHIVIKPADKRSTKVIMGREQYITEAYRQLNNKTYNQKLDQPIYLDTIQTVHNIINPLKEKRFITS